MTGTIVMTDLTLTKTRLTAGRYEGVLSCAGTPPAIEAVHLDRVLGTAEVIEMESHPGHHLVGFDLPPSLMSDGVQTVVLRSADDSAPLDTVTILAGEPLEQDIRAELQQVREELELLKRAFRRHCVETSED